MPSTFFGLDIAVSGMQAYQTALNTTAHNVSNIGTPGYTRQTALRSANNPISLGTSFGMVGTGVRVTNIIQTRSDYYDRKYRYNNSIYGNYATKSHYMSSMENYIYTADPDTGGLYLAFDQLFGSLSSLTSDVSDKVKRTEVVEYADTFASYVNELANNFQTLQQEANFEVKVVVDQINAIAEKITSLNIQISALEIRGESANDLRDARNLLIDELSEYAQVTVTELPPPDDGGKGQFIVRMGGNTLVDTEAFKTINLVPREAKVNQNDVDGLYDLVWSDAQSISYTSLGGTLQALLEVRDGNNQQSFKGRITASETGADGVTEVTVKESNINNALLLNIPETKGVITIGSVNYEYDSFEVQIESDGSYTYTFRLKGTLSNEKKQLLDNAVNRGKEVQIGNDVDYKGVPYYMSLLNEFVRTFSCNFNKVHKEGYDLNGKSGLDFFNAKDKVSGGNYVFDDDATKFSSLILPDGQGVSYASYYSMTALNFTVTQAIIGDVTKIACSDTADVGVSNGVNLLRLDKVRSDNDMFKQGTPAGFLQTLVSSMGIDSQKAKTFMLSQENIVKAIDNRRTSISGVDEDEEATDLIKLQNLLFFQYKVISVMNEVFDKLINGTGV